MNDRTTLRRLQDLAEAACDDRLSLEETTELESLLLDSSLRERYIDYWQMHVELHFRACAVRAGARGILTHLGIAATELYPARDEVSLDQSKVSRRADKRRENTRRSLGSWQPSRYRRAVLAATTVFLVGSIVLLRESSPLVAQREPSPVGCVAELRSAIFEGAAISRGTCLLEGQVLKLQSGSVQVSMAGGAELVLRGPCALKVISANSIALTHGNVSMHMVDWAKGFVVSTRVAKIVDAGARFAVKAVESGYVEVHAYEGHLRVHPTVSHNESQRSILISGGEAIRMEPAQVLAHKTSADPRKYDLSLSTEFPFKPIDIANTGEAIAIGDEDSSWRIVDGPRTDFKGPTYALVCEESGAYLENDPHRSQWISACYPLSKGAVSNAIYTFETQVDLTGYDLQTVSMVAQMIADNGVSAVRLNGKAIELEPWFLNEKGQSFNQFRNVEIAGDFVEGVNTIQIDVRNGVFANRSAKRNPLALRVEWQAFGRVKSLKTATGTIETLASPAVNAIPLPMVSPEGTQ